MASADAIEEARAVLERIGVSTAFSDAELRDIAASGSGSSGRSFKTPSPGSASHAGGDAYHSRLSVPSDLLEELQSPGGVHGAVGLRPRSDAVTRELQASIERLNEQLATEQHERRLLDIEYTRRVRTMQIEHARSIEEATTAVASARATQAAAEAQARLLADRLDASRGSFADLTVSQQLYEELLRVPPESLSLRQFILLKVHERLMAADERVEAARRETEAERRAAAAQRAEADRVARELQHRLAASEGREVALREQTEIQTATATRLQARLSEALGQVEALAAKGSAYDSLDARRRELESVREKDVALAAAHAAAMDVAKADRDAAVARAADLQTRLDMAVADKATLAAGLEDARAQIRRLTEEAAHLSERLHDAVKQRDAYQQQLVSTVAESRSVGEARLSDEIARMRERSAADLEALRVATREAADREVRAAKDARADALAEAARWQQRAESLQRSLDDALTAARSSGADQAAAAAELRGTLRVKSYEAERLSLTVAEQADTVKRLTAECDALREQVTALSGEYSRLESAAESKRVALEAALAQEREKVVMYDRLEVELDNAIVGVASTTAAPLEEESVAAGLQAIGVSAVGAARETASSAGAASGMLPAGSVGLTLAAGVPTTARRRLRQAVLLAKELMAAQREVSDLKKQLTSATQAAEAAGSEAETLRLQLEAVRGPQEYLIAQIRSKDADLRRAADTAERLQAQLELQRQSLAAAQAGKAAAEADLRRLLASRKDVDSLMAVVQEALQMRQPAALRPSVSGASSSGAGAVTQPPADANALLLQAAAAMLQAQQRAATTIGATTPARPSGSQPSRAASGEGGEDDAASSAGSMSTGDLRMPASGGNSPSTTGSASTRSTPPHGDGAGRLLPMPAHGGDGAATRAASAHHVHFAPSPVSSAGYSTARLDTSGSLGGTLTGSAMYTARLMDAPHASTRPLAATSRDARTAAAPSSSMSWGPARYPSGDGVEYVAEAPLASGMHYVRPPM